MQMSLQKGRENYSPSSLESDTPREGAAIGLTSFEETNEGPKRRIRSESFADNFSQARQSYYSRTEPEENHIISAFIFELS
jgi:catalase